MRKVSIGINSSCQKRPTQACKMKKNSERDGSLNSTVVVHSDKSSYLYNFLFVNFNRKFAPRCCACLQPIMPLPGKDEAIRIVALDRSFHVGCYKCEVCVLFFHSYPLIVHWTWIRFYKESRWTLSERMCVFPMPDGGVLDLPITGMVGGGGSGGDTSSFPTSICDVLFLHFHMQTILVGSEPPKIELLFELARTRLFHRS